MSVRTAGRIGQQVGGNHVALPTAPMDTYLEHAIFPLALPAHARPRGMAGALIEVSG
jgi:hypothetical protein